MKDVINIHVMKCGEVGVDPAVPLRKVSKNPFAYTGLLRSKKHRIWIPVFTYLIVHPKGNVLIDTGWSDQVRTHPIKAESFALWFASKPSLPEGSAVNEQIESVGIAPKDLDYVFLTHMDVDHVNGIQLVKDAKAIMASKEEIQEANYGHDVRYSKRQWEGINIGAIPFVKTGLGPIGESFDVFGDGTIQVIRTPGHASGAITVLIRNHDQSVLIAGDTGYCKESWRELELPGPVHDKELMINSLKWVRDLEKEGCIILASHDPEVKEDIIKL